MEISNNRRTILPLAFPREPCKRRNSSLSPTPLSDFPWRHIFLDLPYSNKLVDKIMMPMSFVRFRLAIIVRESFSTATFPSVASRNLIGAYNRKAHVTSSLKATAPITRSWSSMSLDQKEERKQIDGSYKIAKADGMGQAENQVDMSFSKFSDRSVFIRRVQEDFSKYAKFYDKEFLKRSWEEGRAREVFREWKEAQKRVYADAEEEEVRFKIFESLFKYVVETNSKGSLLMGLNNFADKPRKN